MSGLASDFLEPSAGWLETETEINFFGSPSNNSRLHEAWIEKPPTTCNCYQFRLDSTQAVLCLQDNIILTFSATSAVMF